MMTRHQNIEIIWDELSSGLRSFIFSKVKNSATDDILQDVYLKIHDNISTLKDETRIKSWIYQIARNTITDYFRENNWETRASEMIHDLSPETGYSKIMDESIRDMLKMMENLPSDFCEALCMTELDGLSQKEYAELKGLSYSGAKSRVQRARALLREMLLECCHYQFDKYGTVFNIEPKCCCCC